MSGKKNRGMDNGLAGVLVTTTTRGREVLNMPWEVHFINLMDFTAFGYIQYIHA